MITALWHCESGSFATQNLRFYRVKQPLLECKTIGFVTRLCIDSYAIVMLVKNIYILVAFYRGICTVEMAIKKVFKYR